MPRDVIDRLGLSQSSAVKAGLADGTDVVLETFSCVIEWFGELRQIEVVESNAQFPLLGVGLLQRCKVSIDYRLGTVEIT
jgi:predicted aspartyl protease